MSTPSTPQRPRHLSSTSTPSDGGITSPLDQLTPRSKLKALLASVDDSDDEAPLSLPRPREGVTLSNGSALLGDGQGQSGSDTSGEENNEDVIMPRGRLAARLHGQNAPTLKSSGRRVLDISNDHEQVGQVAQDSKGSTEQASREAGSEESEQETSRRTAGRRKKPKVLSDGDESPTKPPSLHTASPRLPISPTPPTRRVENNLSEHDYFPRTSLSPTSKPNVNLHAPIGSDDSDSDFPQNPAANARFLQLVARKKAERQAKVASEKKGREERTARLEEQLQSRRREILEEGISEDDSPDEEGVAEKLTQQSRPTRKASKKAIEEMNRETQRMSRNMQLAHQAKTKKKISKDILLSRFKFGSISEKTVDAIQATSSSAKGSSAPASDAEGRKSRDTPPTSPASPIDELPKTAPFELAPGRETANEEFLDSEEVMPSMEDVMNQPVRKPDKGKARAVDSSLPEPIQKKSSKGFLDLPAIRIKPPKKSANQNRVQPDDSDSDLEIIPVNKSKSSRLAIFDRLPSQKVTEARSLQTLRALAHLTSPSEQSKPRNSITPFEMQISLQVRARQQAAKERAEKIQELKDRGIIVQTAEEREQDQADVEDLLEKARREGEEITKKEKAMAKRERRENGQDELDDSSEDEDYEDVENEIPEAEVSGSDDEGGNEGDEVNESNEEDGDEDEDEDEEDRGAALHGIEGLIDTLASEDSGEEGPVEGEDEIEEDLGEPQIARPNRRNRVNRIVDEEDEDVGDGFSQGMVGKESARNPFIPNLHGYNSVPMGLTQAFAATMAESQSEPVDDLGDEEQDSLAILRNMPGPDFSMLDTKDSMVLNSQPALSQAAEQIDGLEEINIHLSQSQIGHNNLEPATQYSDIPDPTQDTGFKPFSPVLNRFASVPPSTLETVIIPKEGEDEPLVKKKGRLRRRPNADLALNNEGLDEETVNAHDNQFETTANAFDVLKQASKKPAAVIDPFDKKKTGAKGMVEEQAEESEDEYAGLGGASDDESGAEEDEEVRKMIDEGEVKVDERKLAAFYADKERAMDEKAVEKLFKDINSGGLRRKRGADFSLSDSDDDHEARQRRKRQEFQKMRKALLENENVGKIAEDPKKLAFLRAIEDREDDEDWDFLGQALEPAGSQEEPQSQDAMGPPTVAASNVEAVTTGMKRKRALRDSIPDAANRPPPQARRTQPKTKKPSTLAEIRESVSFLIEEPDSMPQNLDSYSSEDDNEEADHSNGLEANANRSHFSSRRARNPIIDRISLKRAESAQNGSASMGSGRMAFHNPNTSFQTGFKVPSLLRRATTQNTALNSAVDSHGISHGIVGTERAIGGDKSAVRKGGTKKSSVNWFAREEERRAKLKAGGEENFRGRVSGSGRGGLGGLLGRGGFE